MAGDPELVGTPPPLAPLAATAIVLAGGRSARFGRDKLAAEVDGIPLLALAVAVVAQVACEVVVVLATDGEEPALASALPGEVVTRLRFVRDEVEGAGPVAGVAAGLAAATQPVALVVGGDMPSLVPGLLASMLRRATNGSGVPVDAVALEQGTRLRPLPCALRVSPARAAAADTLATGGGSLIRFLSLLHLAVIPPGQWRSLDPGGASLRDVDTPADL